MRCLIYVTKSKPDLIIPSRDRYRVNGKIVAEFDSEVEEITKSISSVVEEWYSKELLKKSCLTAFELDDYLKDKNGYAIHINKLKIFDEPKKLSNFYNKVSRETHLGIPLEKAPQNMMKVYDLKNNNTLEPFILISIRPEWACKIMNGEKTIEVRKQVLKDMEETE